MPPLGAYFTNLDRFILPINDYHGFYLSWWCLEHYDWPVCALCQWYSPLATRHCAIGGSVYTDCAVVHRTLRYWVDGETVGELTTMAMIIVVFVCGELADSLTRLYSQNLNLTVERLDARAMCWLMPAC